MKKVICFGEALIDFLQTGSIDDGDLSLNTFTQFPGGAPANVAVAVAKLGGRSTLIGQVGKDQFGDFLLDALQVYGVDTKDTLQHATAKTAIAYVFLDEFGERSFSFRRNQTADILIEKDQIQAMMFGLDNIFHFCSNTLTNASIEKVTEHAVACAHDQQALISFDVNLRPALWANGIIDIEIVNKFIFSSDLVKFAKEELDLLSDGDIDAYIARCLNANVKSILITDGANQISLYTNSGRKDIQPPAVKAVDTTGGGDSFIGAILFSLSKQDNPITLIADIDAFSSQIEFASRCGAYTVARKGAFTAFPRLEEIEG